MSKPTTRYQMKPRYNRKEWVLCTCNNCGRMNYVEPHGTTAQCKCSPNWTEHSNIPSAEEESRLASKPE